jgi:hypothetical protein
MQATPAAADYHRYSERRRILPGRGSIVAYEENKDELSI